MVALRLRPCLLALLAALAAGAPAAQASAPDEPGNAVRVHGPLDDLPVDVPLPDEAVKVNARDGRVGVGVVATVAGIGAGVQMGAGCTAPVAAAGSCSGYVCFMDPGRGDLPVSLGLGHGMYGVGVDLAVVTGAAGGLSILTEGGGGDAGAEEAEPDAAAAEDDGQYGPYHGAFVNTEGHCGP